MGQAPGPNPSQQQQQQQQQGRSRVKLQAQTLASSRAAAAAAATAGQKEWAHTTGRHRDRHAEDRSCACGVPAALPAPSPPHTYTHFSTHTHTTTWCRNLLHMFFSAPSSASCTPYLVQELLAHGLPIPPSASCTPRPCAGTSFTRPSYPSLGLLHPHTFCRNFLHAAFPCGWSAEKATAMWGSTAGSQSSVSMPFRMPWNLALIWGGRGFRGSGFRVLRFRGIWP